MRKEWIYLSAPYSITIRKKYADITVNLQIKNQNYRIIKYFDDQTLDYIHGRFDKESARDFLDRNIRLGDEIMQLLQDSIAPGSETGQRIAKEFWEMILEFTQGDMTILTKLIELKHLTDSGNDWEDRQELIISYIESALDIYVLKAYAAMTAVIFLSMGRWESNCNPPLYLLISIRWKL